MTVPQNQLVKVQTYQKAELAVMQNDCVHIDLANKKLKDFNEKTANLGDSVSFDLTPRYINYGGLQSTQQPSAQRFQTLACTQAVNIQASFSEQQFLFNTKDYMDRFGTAAVAEIGAVVEEDIALNWVTGGFINDPQNVNLGQHNVESGPYRFFGDGVTAINSFQQLDQFCRNFEDYGSAKWDYKLVLPSTYISQIVGSGLNQFATERNNELANKWMIGKLGKYEVYESNMMPDHISGTIGDAAAPNNVLTVVSVNDPTGRNITEITCTEPTGGTDLDAIKIGDALTFIDVPGLPRLRFLKFIGHKPSMQKVQMVATADRGTTAGTITIRVRTTNEVGLCWEAGNANRNLNNVIQPGMQIRVAPSHKAGGIMSGDPLYLAMPRRAPMTPYPSVSEVDKETGASIMHYWGVLFGQNNMSYVRTCLWGSTMVPENSGRLMFPLY